MSDPIHKLQRKLQETDFDIVPMSTATKRRLRVRIMENIPMQKKSTLGGVLWRAGSLILLLLVPLMFWFIQSTTSRDGSLATNPIGAERPESLPDSTATATMAPTPTSSENDVPNELQPILPSPIPVATLTPTVTTLPDEMPPVVSTSWETFSHGAPIPPLEGQPITFESIQMIQMEDGTQTLKTNLLHQLSGNIEGKYLKLFVSWHGNIFPSDPYPLESQNGFVQFTMRGLDSTIDTETPLMIQVDVYEMTNEGVEQIVETAVWSTLLPNYPSLEEGNIEIVGVQEMTRTQTMALVNIIAVSHIGELYTSGQYSTQITQITPSGGGGGGGGGGGQAELLAPHPTWIILPRQVSIGQSWDWQDTLTVKLTLYGTTTDGETPVIHSAQWP